tara:strand:+ start:169 stop:753 length:585 start_codon:yes stop_codon:yes gene_type:complete
MMEKIFTSVAVFAVALMAATAGLGLWIGDLHGQTDQAILRWGTVHRLSGILAALLVVLVNSMSVTYFIGTARWCREVVETYHLSDNFITKSKGIKRRSFPFALFGMLCVVAIVALQGAADPAAGRTGSEAWVNLHLFGRIGLTGVIAVCLQLQRAKIADQQSLIEEVLVEVRAMREARGLDVEPNGITLGSAES